MRFRVAIVFFLCLMADFTFSLAQVADSVQLKAVTVKGNRYLSPVENTVTPVQAVQGSELKRFHPLQTAEVVSRFAGVQIKNYGGVGGMKTVSVRSLGAAHTAVAYDGILLSDVQNGQIDLAKIYMDGLQSVALYNAQAARLFQPARNFQAASLLAIETRGGFEADTAHPFAASFTAGSFGQISPSFEFSKRISPKFAISTHARYGYVYGNYPFEHDLGGTVKRLKRNNSDVQDGQMELNLDYRLSARHRMAAKLFYYGSERGLPGAVISYYDHSAQRLQDHDFFAVIKHNWQISPRFMQQNAVKYNLIYNRFRDPEALSSVPVDNRYLQQEIYVSTVTHYTAPIEGLRASAAVDAAFNFLDADRRGFVEPWRGSLWFNVAANYRHRYFELMLSGLTSAFFDRVRYGMQPQDKARFSPFASVSVLPLGRRNLAVRFFYKDIFRMPTFNDLYYERSGNAALRPEKARQIDVGVSCVLPFEKTRIWLIEASVDAYMNWVDDKIVAYPTNNLFVWSMFNVDKVKTTGIDAVLRVETSLGREGISSAFGLCAQLAYTFLQALDKTSPNAATYNHQVAYTPRHSGSGQLTLKMPYVDLSYRMSFCGARYVLNQNIAENRLAPYVEHGLSLHVRLGFRWADWDLGFDVLNLSDKSYQIVNNYPMPGRHYRCTVACRF